MSHAKIFLAIALISTPAVVAAPLSFEDRVEAQRAIEQVYWSHRIWPKENPGPKPPLSSVMTDDMLRTRVEDYLKKSNALETIWHHPITTRDLQAELNRMAAQSRDPETLAELFDALDIDRGALGSRRIAETLARQTLVDRLIRNWYGSDVRFHAAARAKAEAASGAVQHCRLHEVDGRRVPRDDIPCSEGCGWRSGRSPIAGHRRSRQGRMERPSFDARISPERIP